MRKASITTSILCALLMSVLVAPSAKADGVFPCGDGGNYSVFGSSATNYYDAYPYCRGALNLDSSVTSIGVSGFYNYWWPENGSITSVNIPNSVITIGRNAFYLVFSITSLTFGNSVETIGDYSFEGANPATLVLPDSLKYIGNFSMKHMFRLTSLIIPNNVTFIGEDAFDRSPLTTLTIGRSVTTIGHNAFRSAQLTCLTNLSGLTTAALVNAGISSAADLPSCGASNFAYVSTYDNGFTVQVTNFDPALGYTVTSNAGRATIDSQGLITVTGLGIYQSATVTVTRNGNNPGSSSVTGRSQVAPMLPTNKPTVTISDNLITCTIGSYSATPTSSAFSLFVDGKHVSTIFSAVGEFLPDWIIPWASPSSITRTASLTSATWIMSDAYKGKEISCATLAYSNHATGFTASQVMVAR